MPSRGKQLRQQHQASYWRHSESQRRSNLRNRVLTEGANTGKTGRVADRAERRPPFSSPEGFPWPDGRADMKDRRRMEATHWIDLQGRIRKTPCQRLKRLDFKVPLHAAVRAFVFKRDCFLCAMCGAGPSVIPLNYDGVRTLHVPGAICLEMDHIVSQRCGGSHHPDNLQTLCNSCNARKSVLVDRKKKAVCHA